jgi:predicted nucleic acid-binding protein
VATASKRRPEPRLRGPLYLDASALVKLYLPEPESDDLNRLLVGRHDVVVSDLAVTEIVSSLCRRRREGSLTTAVVSRLHGALLGHIEAGVYRRFELIPAAHREAERLLISLGTVPLRAADALHLALALGAEAASLLTWDRRLGAAARAIGLGVFPVRV